VTFQKGQNWPEWHPVEPRLEKYSIPEPNSGCHLWLAALSTDGYAQLSVQGRNRNAHIVAYELAKGPVPDGMQIDHLCRLHCCVNPDHLEAVTGSENVRRGLGPTVTRARLRMDVLCPHGHTDVVWYIRKNGKRQKECLTCQAIRKRARKANAQ
jgi:hypothetical protein